MLDNHYVPEGYGIISNFKIGNYTISTYTFFVVLALLLGTVCYFITMIKDDKVTCEKSYLIVIAALFFGFVGSKILVIIENIEIIFKDFSTIKNFLYTGKSIIGGLIGGYFGVILIKKMCHMENIKSGNRIAPSIALGMAIGRIGCFLTGCCYGIESNLLGIDFGDGIKRIPTQLIELAFCLILFIYLLNKQLKKKDIIPGILFKELLLYYFIFRFFIEFIRGTEKNILFLSIYQIICFCGIIIVYFKIKKEYKNGRESK